MRPGRSGLKLRVCYLSGLQSNIKFEYEADENGVPAADALNNEWQIQRVENAFSCR